MRSQTPSSRLTEQKVVVRFPLVAPDPRWQVDRSLHCVRKGHPFGAIADHQTGKCQGENAEQECYPSGKPIS